MKKAMVIGCLGMDGSYMCDLLSGMGYLIIGIVHPDTQQKRISEFYKTYKNRLILDIDVTNAVALSNAINRLCPDEIYNFAGVTNTFDPFSKAEEIWKMNANLPVNILETIKFNKNIKFFNASSCLTRINSGQTNINEKTPYAPLYPYGASKAFAEMMIKVYREQYGIFAVSGIFFPHESERRGADFFTKKIAGHVSSVAHCKKIRNAIMGGGWKKDIGSLNFSRDWGYAPEYMDAVYLMMNARFPKDYVIGTGIKTTGKQFLEKCSEVVGFDVSEYFNEMSDGSGSYPEVVADASAIKQDLGWFPKVTIDEIIIKMIGK